ncbi:Bbp19 family protein [Azospirillum aestuarii]|uniref:Bbp19 family protein n=1 Tax=Azospirillum aestuarii TaxID=2802052 RepID=UPI004054DBB5
MADPVDWNNGGWGWLEGAPPAESGPAGDPAPSFARCFAGPDGARVLATLKAMTLERTLGPDASDAALRDLEGQRRLVALILALTNRGQGV